MSDMNESRAATRTPAWVRVLLVLSLAGNVLVLGTLAGAFVFDRRAGDRGPDVGLGPFSAAFGPDDRKALRDAFLTRTPDLRDVRQAERAEIQAIVAAIRTEPFDPAAVTAALDVLQSRVAQRIEIGRELIVERLSAMDAAGRAAFADRLEGAMRRPRGHD